MKNANKQPCITWDQASARRLERNGLIDPVQEAAPAEIVRAMVAAHAQVMSAGELSIALRGEGLTVRHVRDALWQEHSLVKTYGPRGTVHILPTADLPMWCGALTALPYGQSPDLRGGLLTPAQAEELIEAIAVVLEDAELTTDELTEALVKQVGPWAGERVMEAFQDKWPRWRMVQATAGVRGALCFGPNRGSKVTFTNPRRWLPGFQPQKEQTALAGLARSFLHSYGPSTPAHFARWLATSPRWASDLFDSLGDALEQVGFEDGSAWLAAGDSAMPSAPPQGVRLLPYFDSYTIDSYPRERIFPGPAYQRALSGGQAGNFPVLLIDGDVAGVWHKRQSGKKIEITIEPLRELTSAQTKALEEQVSRIGEILEGKAQYKIGTVTVGPHA